MYRDRYDYEDPCGWLDPAAIDLRLLVTADGEVVWRARRRVVRHARSIRSRHDARTFARRAGRLKAEGSLASSRDADLLLIGILSSSHPLPPEEGNRLVRDAYTESILQAAR